MGFISYSMKYYADALEHLDSAPVTDAGVYRAQQLLKMLDDLTDEGYTGLCDQLEQAFGGVSRLRQYLRSSGAQPFAIPPKLPAGVYGMDAFELTAALDDLTEKAAHSGEVCGDPFLSELIRFCGWIGCEDGTAYIFLLRDALLPYVYYRSRGRCGLHPWLLGRRAFEAMTGNPYADDEIRSSVIAALESGACGDFDSFREFVLPDMQKTLSRYPEAVGHLTNLLQTIPEQRVIVVESGCYGTFPLLLMSLDPRVDMRMYTTVPYLADVFGDRIFTQKYENNRLFETLYSQDAYLKFAGFRDGRFYVNRCTDAAIEANALAEVRAMLG